MSQNSNPLPVFKIVRMISNQSRQMLLNVSILCCTIFLFTLASAQVKDSTDLMSMLDQEMAKSPATNYTSATFKTTRLINAHSIEQVAANVLDVKISHRFGTLNSGFYELFGLDNASIRIGADYGITDWLMIGLGRSSFEKQYDGFMKFRLLRQSKGDRNMPLSVSGLAGIYVNSLRWSDPNRENYFSSRLNYTFQLLLARKFTEGFSLQLSPTLVHKNLVPLADDPNDLFSLGIGARQKITKRISVNVEYYHQFTKLEGSVNPLSVGFDIETGGHVFQLIFTNSTGIAENQYITQTNGKWGNGDIHFGFNISRVFTLGKKKKEAKGKP